MAAIIIQTIPVFTHKFQKKVSSFLQLHMKTKLFVKTTASPITTKRRVFSACKNHIVLLGNVQELLKRLDKFCLTYQHVDCLYTLFKYRFSGKIIAKRGQLFDNVQQAVDFDHKNKGVDRMPSIANKTLEEKVQKTFVQLLSKNKNNAEQWFSVCRKN